MSGSSIIFYLLALQTVLCAVLSVSTRNILRAAIYLLFTLLGMAGIYFWLSYDFIAAVQIIVYAGGISVLIIFSIFLTQQAGEPLPLPKPGRVVFSALATLCALGLLYMQLARYAFPIAKSAAAGPSVMDIGKKMLDTEAGGYALPFEVISILLLAAMIGCIVIAMQNPDSKTFTNRQTDIP